MREDITFGQLRTFVCAAKLGSFVKAADRLGVSQPAVSDQIGTLEKRLQASLFERRRGTTPTLTPRGLTVLEEAEHILAASENLLGPKGEDGTRESVRIAIGPHLRDMFLNPLIGGIYREHPGTDIDLRPVVPYPEALKQIRNGQLDMVVYTVAAFGVRYPEDIQVCEVPVSFVASPEVRASLAAGKTALKDYDILLPCDRDPRASRWVNHMLQAADLSPARPPRFLNDWEMVSNMAKEGLGVAYLMPESILPDLEAGTLELLDTKLPPMIRILAVTPQPSPAVRYIETQLRQSFAKASSSMWRFLKGHTVKQ